MITAYSSSKPETMKAFFGQIDENQRYTLMNWFCYGYHPGSSTAAVLNNELHESMVRFVETPGALLAMTVWLHEYTPRRGMEAWTVMKEKHGLVEFDCLRRGLQIFADLGDQGAAAAIAEIWGVEIEVPE